MNVFVRQILADNCVFESECRNMRIEGTTSVAEYFRMEGKELAIFRKFTVTGIEPIIKALFRNPVDGADPDPTEFIPLQECINGFAADA